MAALLGKLAMSAAGSANSAAHSGNADSATVVVRVGRGVYVLSASGIALLWYFGWRNQRVNAGTGKFPIPGLNKDPVVSPDGAEDAGIAADVSLPDVTGVAPGTGIPAVNPNVPTVKGATSYGGRLPPPASPTGNRTFLDYLGHVAQSAFNLNVHENPDFGGVTPVHVTGSYHYRGRAFDASGTPDNESRFANWVAQNYGPHITELFWRGKNWVIYKNGVRQSNFNFVSGHKDHVHVAV